MSTPFSMSGPYVTRTNVTETNANIQNTLDHLDLIDLGYMQKVSFLGHQEVVKIDGLRVGGRWEGGGCVSGWSHENNAKFWLHFAS